MSSEKQKALDRSTSWSKDQWDKEEQLWYRSRKDEWGQTERCYPYDGQAIPRAFGYNDSTTTEDTGINYSDYSQVTANSLYQQPGAISPTGNLEQSTQYTPSYTTANTSSYHSGAYFNTSTYSNHLGGSDQASFYESPPIASASADGIAQDIGNLSFRRQSTIPEHGQNPILQELIEYSLTNITIKRMEISKTSQSNTSGKSPIAALKNRLIRVRRSSGYAERI